MTTPSDIEIKLNDVDITGQVLFKECSFTMQANPVQGTFKIAVKDVAQTFAPVAGQKLTLHVDGVPLFGGYVMRIGRGFFFPAEDSTVPANVARKWILSGPDFNMLFDKRVVYDPNDFTAALTVPSGQRTISKAFTYLMNNYIDVPSGLDYATHRDVITTAYGDPTQGSSYVGQGKTWRAQMEDFMDHGAVMYYIDADFNVHLHEYETTRVSWGFSDQPDGTTFIGFREGEFSEDYGQLVTDALVWGGSSISSTDGGTGGDIVFARYPDPPANNVTVWAGTESERVLPAHREQTAIDRQNALGRWQRGEERAGQKNYLSQDSVITRAFQIVAGAPGEVPTEGVEAGFGKALDTMSCAWFAHDVPSNEHVPVGYLMDFILYTQGDAGGALSKTLPLRSLRVSFPTLPGNNPTAANKAYVRFDGEFGVSFSDRRYLWKAIKRQRAELRSTGAIVIVDNSSTSVPPGSQQTVWPLEAPDGSRTVFTFPFTFYEDRLDVFINGLTQRNNIDYTYDANTKQVTFVTAPGVGDQIWAVGFGSQ